MTQYNFENPPLLVTGAHRTGTTWVGKMLAASEGMTYLSEPLNVLHRRGVMRAPVKYWYTYICAENEKCYLPALLETLCFRYHTWAEIRSLRSRKDLGRMGRDWVNFFRGRLGRRRALLKDPFAVFSIPWFIQRLGCPVVVTVRHPAAFASSLKRLDWPFDFADFLAQPLLMRDGLEPFRSQMEAMLASPEDVIGQAALLWRVVYQAVDEYREHFPQVIVIRHEDLSRDPLGGFQSLYASLGLGFTPSVQQTILKSSSSENPKEVSKKSIYSVRLDSRSNLENWKKRLNRDEINSIREVTEDIAGRYYPDIDWS